MSDAESHDDPDIHAIEAALAGAELDATKAANLETHLSNHPDDLVTRIKLLGYCSSARYDSPDANEAFRLHALYVIKNYPDADIAGSPFCIIHKQTDPNGYRDAKQLWNNHTAANPTNVTILGHAANFLLLADRMEAEHLLKQARSLDPNNPKWSDRLAHLYTLHRGTADAAKALAEYEIAQSFDDNELSKFNRLDSLAKSAYDAGELGKAAQYAEELLNLSKNYEFHNGNAIHRGNIILGRIALKSGDVDLAKTYLLNAGSTPGSPNLCSFGPNMSLAKELLEAGEQDAVLQYFDLCRIFWNGHGHILDEWTKAVKAAQIPNFGPNLVY